MTALDNVIAYIAHPFALMLMGLLAHFLRKIMAAVSHGTETRPCVTDYWKKHPIQSGISMIGAVAGYAMFAHFPDFNSMATEVQNVVRVTAFGIGFMADNVVDAVGDKAINRIRGS
jgi:hypothetical protein